MNDIKTIADILPLKLDDLYGIIFGIVMVPAGIFYLRYELRQPKPKNESPEKRSAREMGDFARIGKSWLLIVGGVTIILLSIIKKH